MTNREAFHERRATGIGGSDVAAIFNLDPYRDSRAVWREKRGLVEPGEPDVTARKWLDRGKKLEPLIRERYMERTGNRVTEVGRFRRHPTHRFMISHPDGTVHDDAHPEPGLLECKHAALLTFAKIEREGIPWHWQLQVQHNLYVTGRPWCDVAVLNAERWDMVVVRVPADETVQLALVQSEREFWRYVETGTVPPEQQSAAAPEELPATPTNTEVVTVTDEVAVAAIADYRSAQELEATAKELKQVARDKLVAALPGVGVYETDEARVYYSLNAARDRLDKKALESARLVDPTKLQLWAQQAGVTLPALDRIKLDLTAFLIPGSPYESVRVYALHGHTRGEG